MSSPKRRCGIVAFTVVTLLSCSGGESGRPGHPPLPPLKVNPFAGLEPMGESTAQSFSFRPGPKPPPTTTSKERLPFPAAQAEAMRQQRAARPSPGPLQVLRTQPRGENKLIGAVTVDFNQPMVPVASLAKLRELHVPLRITPTVKGRFRWLGTQTLAFEPEGRMPFGTDYVAVIPAGTSSALGGVLESEVSFRFSTPPPDLNRMLPVRYSSQVRPDTAIALEFNQKVRSSEVLSLLRLNELTGNDMQVVSRSAWAKLPEIGFEVVTWDPERTLVLQPRRPLAKATTYNFSIAPGLVGEGPRRSLQKLWNSFSTYGPLTVIETRCGQTTCNPAGGIAVVFSNPLRTTEVDKLVELSPAVPDLQTRVSGTWLTMQGEFAAQTTYKVKIKPGFVDVHEQRLASAVEQKVKLADISPDLRFPVQGMAVLELRGKRQIPLEVQNVASARLRLLAADPEQILQVLETARNTWDDEGRRDPLKGLRGLKVTRTLKTGVKPNGKAKLGLSTDEALGPGGAGPLYVELRSDELRKEWRWASPFRTILVQVTDIGIMARYDSDQIVALLTKLEAGTPLAGAQVELRDGQGKPIWTGRSDRGGMVKAPGRRVLAKDAPYVLWARSGRDRAFVILDGHGDDGQWVGTYTSWGSAPAKEVLALHLFSDRNPYRPGEKVHLKGVLRRKSTLPDGVLAALAPEVREVSYKVNSAQGHLVSEGKAQLSESGSFAVDVNIPEGSDLGTYSVQVQPTAGSLRTPALGSFQVEEYRAPEFAVKVSVTGEPYFFKDQLKAEVGADYLFGAPMAGAQCSWTLTRSAAVFTPPGNPGFSFGEPAPWRWGWRVQRGPRRHREGMREDYSLVQESGDGEVVEQGTQALDARGRLPVTVKLLPDSEEKRIGPASFTLEAQVFDQNRQSIANRHTVVVHPADRYIGLRPEKIVIKAGESLKAHAVLVDLAGKRLAGQPLTLQALRVETKVRTVYEEGRWIYKYDDQEVKVGSCTITTADEPRGCEITLPRPGGYKLRADFKDSKGRLARTTVNVYAFGPGYVPWNLQNQSQIELVADKSEYRPGEVAKVLIKSPLAKAIGLLTLSRGGIDKIQTLKMDGSAQIIEVPIQPYYLPEVHVSVALARGRLDEKTLGKAAKDLGRPTFAHGTLRLPVSLAEKTMQISVKPDRETVGPSEKLDIKLRATDAAGKPLRGELAVMVVDEGVLSLLQYQTPDPLAFFFASRGSDSPLVDLRNVLLGKEEGLKKEAARRSGKKTINLQAVSIEGKDVGGYAFAKEKKADTPSAAPPSPMRASLAAGEPSPSGHLRSRTNDYREEEANASGVAAPRIRSRSNFATTAYFNPSVLTDEQGRASLTVNMPDNLTTYRIMVVALDRGAIDRFGKGEAQVKVRKPLLLRPSLPRFLSTDDRFEASVMVHNESGKDGTVDVLVRARGAKAEEGVDRIQVQIPNGGAKEVRFKMQQSGPGPARFQFAAVLDRSTDAVEKQIPVLLPVTTEAFATYGMTDGSVAQPVAPPADAMPGYGALSVSMASTALNGLEDAVSYLFDYPYECTEQTASRVLPIFSLKNILKDFHIAKLTDLAAQKRLAENGVRKLVALQRYDGGWGNWEGSNLSWPHLSAYATFALRRAREAGYQVPDYNLQRARNFLKYRLDHPMTEFLEQYNYVAQVASVWMLSEMGQHEKAHLSRLHGLRAKLPLFAQAWLAQALYRAEGRSARVKEMLREFQNAAVQTAAAAHFSEGQTESLRLLMHSNDRTDAIMLSALLEVDPDNVLLPKVARGLLDARVRGRWSTTQANAFALVALSRYYKQIERVTPDFVSQIWYGDGYLGEGTFKGRQMKIVEQQIPLDALRQRGDQELVLQKRGEGKLYYRIGVSYAPKDMHLPPEEQGFSVSRLYESIADPKTGKPESSVRRRDDGTWEIKAGATVRVRLVVVVPDYRYFVAIADPLPAGLEGVNLTFATSARSSLSGQLDNRTYDTWSWYSLFAFEHREMRDDRVVLFADRLPAGIYEYTYLARATTFGRFVVAPVKAEEMYHPETFGRSGTEFVEVN